VRRWVAGLSLAGRLACAPPEAPGGAVSEEQARAGFLFQLAQYVQWPRDTFAGDAAPIRFCVVGQDALAPTLETIVQGKRIQGRPILVANLDHPAVLTSCQVAYVGYRREQQLRELLTRWPYPPTLLVGESSRFAELGGIVNLILRDGRVSFEINTAAAERARLELRSQLLRFARIVGDRKEMAR
jgi:hypothetical protein